MLKKWFPQMGNFSGQLKKYKVTINDLLAEDVYKRQATKVMTSETLKHDSAVQYALSKTDNTLKLPEKYNGCLLYTSRCV